MEPVRGNPLQGEFISRCDSYKEHLLKKGDSSRSSSLQLEADCHCDDKQFFILSFPAPAHCSKLPARGGRAIAAHSIGRAVRPSALRRERRAAQFPDPARAGQLQAADLVRQCGDHAQAAGGDRPAGLVPRAREFQYPPGRVYVGGPATDAYEGARETVRRHISASPGPATKSCCPSQFCGATVSRRRCGPRLLSTTPVTKSTR